MTERMKAAGLAGSVVHISSVGSKHAAPNTSVYSVTKAAVDHLTRCMAVELAANKVCSCSSSYSTPTIGAYVSIERIR